MTDETYSLLQEVTYRRMVTLSERLDNSSNGNGHELNEKLIDEVAKLTNILNEEDKKDYEKFDKQERRRIEEERNQEMAKIEMAKQDLTWKKVIMEVAKTFGPSVLTMIGYNLFQKRILKFEETGRLTSTASRELHLPNFLKK